ncbi:MAG: hypothetical protein HFI81_10065 [Eubacterium sp.]|jgi:hypothetical protein|nr:hypothetical protein [Eubacterium sp.]
MIEYSTFYEVNHPCKDDLHKNEENLRDKTELENYKNLIQQLGYAHFDD